MNPTEFEKKFEALKQKFPRRDRIYNNVENCDYCEDIFQSKDCYWCFNGAKLNECYYNTDGFHEVNDIDCDNGVTSERCFESTDFAQCTDCYFVQHCVRCYNVWHSYMLTDCNDCFGCANLSNKSFCIFNVQHTKDEYEKELKKLKKEPAEKIQKKLAEVVLNFPKINAYYDDAENSDYADYVFFVKNLYYCFDCSNSQDCGYMELSHYCKDTYDALYGLRFEGCNWASYGSDCYGCYMIDHSSRCYDSYYLYECFDCHDCFACAFLSNKQYCIFNIQYTKEEYEKKLAELKQELGIYFNVDSSKAKKV